MTQHRQEGDDATRILQGLFFHQIADCIDATNNISFAAYDLLTGLNPLLWT